MRPSFSPTAVALSLLLGACERPQRAPLDTAVKPATQPTLSAVVTPSETVRFAGTRQVAPERAPEGSQPPIMPAVFPGPVLFPRACEGEDCEVEFPAFACGAVQLRSAAADTAPIVARVARGDTVDVRSRDLHVLVPGRIVLRRNFALTDWKGEEGRIPRQDTLRFAAGDTVYLLRYHELGAWTWWHRGGLQDGDEFWAGPRDGELGGVMRKRDSSVAVGLSHPRSEDWWRVQLKSGQSGWWRADTLYSLLSIHWMRHWASGCPPWK
jgi:hypothetical protein